MLRRKIEDMLSAATFAEAGEFETAKELARGSRKVLLVLTGRQSDSKSFMYAMNVAERVEAGLEIMFFTDRASGDSVLNKHLDVLKKNDIEFHVTRVAGCMKTHILEYTANRSNIQFVVAESIEALNNECQQESRSLRGALKDLRCPLVLVSEMDRS